MLTPALPAEPVGLAGAVALEAGWRRARLGLAGRPVILTHVVHTVVLSAQFRLRGRLSLPLAHVTAFVAPARHRTLRGAALLTHTNTPSRRYFTASRRRHVAATPASRRSQTHTITVHSVRCTGPAASPTRCTVATAGRRRQGRPPPIGRHRAVAVAVAERRPLLSCCCYTDRHRWLTDDWRRGGTLPDVDRQAQRRAVSRRASRPRPPDRNTAHKRAQSTELRRAGRPPPPIAPLSAPGNCHCRRPTDRRRKRALERLSFIKTDQKSPRNRRKTISKSPTYRL